ncbi:MAG: hypothetical protein H7842_06465 [Gammaproteobacteria bacterium SHHR-1]|uniref:magnetosome protein MamD n=1 Tax=Magnetovirga frankeli TaxID=947516 RepID=UPI001293FE21|nr:hypothetical protein D5125_16210 [gamma proteobacterium SS-5]
MATNLVMAQVDGANQVSQLLAASGSKTFTVGKVATAAGAGNNAIITLTPSGGGSAVAVKLEGMRQAAELSGLVGKTVAVGKPSMMAGAGLMNNWLIFQPVTAGAAQTAAGSATLIKLEGVRQGMQAASLSGQKVTLVQPMMAGKGAGSTLFLQPNGGGEMIALKMANGTAMSSNLVGKSFIIGKAPAIAGGNTSTWLVLKPAGSATAAKVAASTTTAKVASSAASAKASGAAIAKASAPLVKAQTIAFNAAPAATAGSATAAQTAAATSATVKGVATGGTIWKGTGLSLGLGLGLGAWGPVLVAGIGASAAYGYWRSKRQASELIES